MHLDIPRIFLSPKLQHRSHNSMVVTPTLRHMNLILPSYVFNTQVNIPPIFDEFFYVVSFSEFSCQKKFFSHACTYPA